MGPKPPCVPRPVVYVATALALCPNDLFYPGRQTLGTTRYSTYQPVGHGSGDGRSTLYTRARYRESLMGPLNAKMGIGGLSCEKAPLAASHFSINPILI